MNIDDMLLNAIKNNDMIKFLCGEGIIWFKHHSMIQSQN